MKHHENTLLIVAIISLLFAVSSPASARSNEAGNTHKSVVTTKIARAERHDGNRHENGNRRDNGKQRDSGKSRNNNSDSRKHSPSKPIGQHGQDRNRDQHRDRNQQHRKNDQHLNPKPYAYRHAANHNSYKKGHGYWRDYHSGHNHGYQHRYYNGRNYYYNHVGFYFPGFGYIEHGHQHHHGCPGWHFEPFAAGLLLGTILGH